MANLKSNLVFDVGLHKGEDTEFYLRSGFDVVAFEANPVLVELCSRRFSQQIAEGRLRIIEGAIAPPKRGDKIQFYQNSMSVWGTIVPEWDSRNKSYGTTSVPIAVDRTDMVKSFREFGIPYYLKIDVEGADMHVLQCLEGFEEKPHYVSIESEKVCFKRLELEITTLSNLGYNHFKAVQQAGVQDREIVCHDINGQSFVHRFADAASGAFGEDIAQPWLTETEVLNEYENIFERYRTSPEPSWFDTHARHADEPSD